MRYYIFYCPFLTGCVSLIPFTDGVCYGSEGGESSSPMYANTATAAMRIKTQAEKKASKGKKAKKALRQDPAKVGISKPCLTHPNMCIIWLKMSHGTLSHNQHGSV